MQGQCKPNAIELARIAEVQPVLADFIGKGRAFFHAPPLKSSSRQIIVFSVVNRAGQSSNSRQNHLFDNVPKRIAKFLLRTVLHIVVSLALVVEVYLAPKVLIGIQAHL